MSKIMTVMPWVGGMGGAPGIVFGGGGANAGAVGIVFAGNGAAVANAGAAGIVFGGGGAVIKGMAMAVMSPVVPAVVAMAAPAIAPAVYRTLEISPHCLIKNRTI